MKAATLAPNTRSIALDEIFPHPPETLWRALTDGALIARWLMEPKGFAPTVGTRFTFQANPKGAWDGTIQCEILEIERPRRIVYSWQGGDEGNLEYGAPLDSVVAFTLTPVTGGTRLQLVHSGFAIPRNDWAHQHMDEGWRRIMRRLRESLDR